MKYARYIRILQGLLAIAGIGFFFVLIRDGSFSELFARSEHDLLPLAAIVAGLAVVNYSFDTFSWWLICDGERPGLLTLASIRVRCEAITNILPGGAMIGEPMKVALLMQSTGASRAAATTSFLLSKFTIICGHVLYVLTGIALSFAVIENSSSRTFGTPHLATIALAFALTLLVSLVALLIAMIWVRPLAKWLAPTRRERRWSARWNTMVAELHRVEELIGSATRGGTVRLIAAIVCGFIAWSFNAIEAYVILRWLGVELLFGATFAIDSVSSIVRMLFFFLPIGIGGQDWAITGLMSAYGVQSPVAAAAHLVLLKRARELTVVGIGLALLAITSRQRVATRNSAPAKLHSVVVPEADDTTN